MSPPRPHLPKEFIEQIMADPTLSADYNSIIFTDDFQDTRLQMVAARASESMSPDAIADIKKSKAQDNIFGIHLEQPQIHAAAMQGDPLAVCELIRLGVSVDLEDTVEHTPLNTALTFVTMPLMMGQHLGNLSPGHVARATYIVRILIEQHANVNHIPKNDMGPLYWACYVRNWDLVTLLLKHGADHLKESHLYTLFRDPRDRARYDALIEAHPPGQKRPPQKCPCWSGKLLQDCHALRQPYPTDFYCTCGSKQPYGECCARRNIRLFDVWNSQLRYLQQFHSRPTGPVTTGDGRTTTDEMVRAHHICVPREYLGPGGLSEDEASSFLIRITEAMLAQKLIDPAVSFAMREAKFLPRPYGSSINKLACEEAEKKWNAAIDRYIENRPPGIRTKIDIERAAKIRQSGGALYRRCEGPKCDKMEAKDIEKLHVCAKCRMSVYCSRACQTKAWRTHKIICGDVSQREQALPSLVAIDQFLLSVGEPQEAEDLDWPSLVKQAT